MAARQLELNRARAQMAYKAAKVARARLERSEHVAAVNKKKNEDAAWGMQ
jgi:hypothetical protein